MAETERLLEQYELKYRRAVCIEEGFGREE